MRKILLVEDEKLLRDAYTTVLSSGPYDLCVTKNGREALKKTGSTKFDLILLDLMMPMLNGLGFLKEFDFQANPKTKIVVLSNLSAGKEVEDAIKLGAHRTVLKAEISPRELIALVRYELEST